MKSEQLEAAEAADLGCPRFVMCVNPNMAASK